MEGKIGWRIEKDSEGMTLHPDHVNDNWHLGPGWVMPMWSPIFPESYDEDEMMALVYRIRAKGIRVEGTTVEAFGIFEEFDDEVGLCLTEDACESGDFVECRKMMGEEYVADLIEDLICVG